MFIQNGIRIKSKALLIAFTFLITLQPTVHAGRLSESRNDGPSDSSALELGKTVEREIKGGEQHSYQINLSAGQFLNASVEQNKVILTAAIYGPSNNQLIELKGWQRNFGKMPIYWIAAETGSYKIKVNPVSEKAGVGQYGIRLEDIKTAREEDRDKVSGQAAFVEANGIYEEGSKESKEKALVRLSDAVSKYKAAADRFSEGYTLQFMGRIYIEMGDNQKALDHCNQALTLHRQVGDRSSEGSTLTNIGKICDGIGEKKKALDYYDQALALQRQMGNVADEAVTLNNMGAVYDDLGEKKKALDYYDQALALHRQMGNRTSEANTLTNIGVLQLSVGDVQKAIDYFVQALALHREMGNRSSEAVTLNNIGALYHAIGENQKAVNYLNQALAQRRQIGDRTGEAATLNNMGAIYDDLGEKQKALDYLNQALPLRRQIRDRTGEANTLNNTGKVYDSIGEKQKALDYYSQSLALHKQVGNVANAANSLTNIGKVYDDLGEKQKALDFYNQALPLHKQAGNRSSEAMTLNNIGAICNDLGENQKALDYYSQSLTLSRQVENRISEANTLTNIGKVYFSLGDNQKALEYFNQALPLHRQIGSRANEAITLTGISSIEREQGKLADARANVESAIKLVEFIRTNVAGQQLRSSYFATIRHYYELQTDVLMGLHKASPKEGFDALALQASEQSRARSLVELLAEARVDIREGVDAKLLEREKDLRQLINDKSDLLLRMKNRKNTAEQIAQAEKALNGLLSEYSETQNQIRSASPKYAALTQPTALTLKDIQQLLDSDTVLVEYSLGEKRSYMWLVSSTSISSYELPPRKLIDDKAKDFYSLLTSPLRDGKQTSADYQKTATELGSMLLGPVKTELGKKRLLVVAEGSLQYVPFAALSLNASDKAEVAAYSPLILEHEIVSLPSVSTLAVQRRELANRPAADKLLAVFADPVFEREDPRVKQSLAQKAAQPSVETASLNKEATRGEAESLSVIDELEQSKLLRSIEETAIVRDKGFARLLGSRREANSISSLVEKEKLLSALDFDANRTTAFSEQVSRYRYLHFATHGLLNSAHPELSGIMLSLVDKEGNSQRGFLKLDEIYNLKLNAELAVLSGCETGLGKEVKGEGLVGLTRGFMYAGAKSVLASLWKVQDFTTAELMGDFYKQMIKEGKKPSEALRLAQISMMKKEQWNNPFFWAGFTFQGDWR